jgi:hypothetical protein
MSAQQRQFLENAFPQVTGAQREASYSKLDALSEFQRERWRGRVRAHSAKSLRARSAAGPMLKTTVALRSTAP